MLKSTLLSLATIVSAVMAGSVKITSPKPGNVWEIGKEVDITWYAITYQRASVSNEQFLLNLLLLGIRPPLAISLFLFCWLQDLLRLLPLIWSSPTKFLLLRDTTNGPFLPASSPARSSKWHIRFRVYDQ